MKIRDDVAIGLIPARGGSKSIPLKNLAPLGGKTLVSYVMRAGLGAPSLNAVYCSTDHPAIARAANEGGVRVLNRPASLAEDDTPVTAVILHVLETLERSIGYMPGMVALLQPTSPFLLLDHIESCLAALRGRPDADSSQTITPVFHNAHAFNQRVVEDGLVRFRFLAERQAAYNKQRKPKHYTFGNLVITRSRALLAGKDCFGEVSVPVEIPRLYAFDVDTRDDLDYANYLIEQSKVALSRAAL